MSLKNFFIFLFMTTIVISCVSYNHYFYSDPFFIENSQNEYSHSIILYTSGPKNRYKKMDTRSFAVSIKTTPNNIVTSSKFEVEGINDNFVIDSIWFSILNGSIIDVLFPRDTIINHREKYWNIKFNLHHYDNNQLTLQRIEIPDSIKTLIVVIPYYSTIHEMKIYDTLTTTINRSVNKHSYLID